MRFGRERQRRRKESPIGECAGEILCLQRKSSCQTPDHNAAMTVVNGASFFVGEINIRYTSRKT